MANRLHDSVLQTLVVLRRDATDAPQVRYLARRQERELRRTIDEYRSPYDNSLRAALLSICGEVEDLYRVEVDAVIRGDAEMDSAGHGLKNSLLARVEAAGGTATVTSEAGEGTEVAILVSAAS